MTRTYSAEYKRLQPYVVEEIRKVVNAALLTGGGGGGTGLTKHALNSIYHSGELAQTQAPWAATKVELSNHAALPDVHHAKLHGITDAANHSVTGSQYQIVGLTAVNTLGLLTPSATPAANAVVKTDGASAVTLVDLTVTSDLFMSGYLDFGTDVIYEDASYLQVTGSKAVRFGQNIGNAAWTIYNAGGASFGGSVDIISGGDLTVAGSGAYAGNQVLFADSSGGNVGIMRAPDSQFALDINGPARATYWIGPHAIQLKNVLFLAHYDGRYPYATNYSGEPNGHMGQVATVGGTIVYKAGKFYKAVQTGASTTNLCPNPSFETGTASWSLTDTNSSATMTRVSTVAYAGTYSLQLTNTTSGQDDYASINISGVSASTAYTISAYVYVTEWVAGANANRGLFAYDSANAGGTQQFTTITGSTNGEWVRHSVTVTTTSSPGNIVVRLYSPRARVFWDAVQVEAGAGSGYCDGDMPGHTWSGTAHASTSTRPDGAYLVYPTAGNINVNVGTVMAWVHPYRTSGVQTVFRVNGTTTGNIILRANGTTLEGFWGTQTISAASQIAANTWTHVAMIYDGATLYLYVNGAHVASGTASGFGGTPASMYVGSAYNTNEMLTGLIDDLCILDRAMTIGAGNVCSEMRSVYESNAPVFAETSTFTFRPTPKGLIWADDEGLWMRDTAGKPVLGVYGGEAATKNWGGFDLVPGDLLLGNNAVGSSAIWWSRVSGKFGFYGAGSGTPQVEIATDGSLMAGAGKVRLNNADGFTAFNASNAATIYINADGIAAADGGARTTVGSWTSGSRFKWYSVGEMYAATPESYLDDSSISRTLYPLVMRAIRQGNDAGLVEISAVNTSNVGAFLRVGEGFRLKDYYGTPYFTNRVVHASATDIILECTNLQLRSLTTSGAAVGTYSGKIRIQIAGTNYYIPYYAS